MNELGPQIYVVVVVFFSFVSFFLSFSVITSKSIASAGSLHIVSLSRSLFLFSLSLFLPFSIVDVSVCVSLFYSIRLFIPWCFWIAVAPKTVIKRRTNMFAWKTNSQRCEAHDSTKALVQSNAIFAVAVVVVVRVCCCCCCCCHHRRRHRRHRSHFYRLVLLSLPLQLYMNLKHVRHETVDRNMIFHVFFRKKKQQQPPDTYCTE